MAGIAVTLSLWITNAVGATDIHYMWVLLPVMLPYSAFVLGTLIICLTACAKD